MSSSQQRSRRKESAGRGLKCPSCGRKELKDVVETVVIRVKRRVFHFEDVAHERCLSCGERVFGIDVSLRFDAAILGRRRDHAA